MRRLGLRYSSTLLLVSLLSFGEEAPKTHTTSGQSTVEGYLGSYSYSFQMKVPAFHGVEPRLSFSYNSNSREGWLGRGWSLTGLPVIDRVSSGKGAPFFDANDTYVLDGQEIIPCVSGMVAASCAAGGTHTTKIESYLKITRDLTADTWTVWQKNGTKTVFRPTYVASRLKSNCPEFSITGGVRSGWYYLTGLVGKGSWLEWHSGWDNGSGVLQALTLKGFTASGGSPIGHQVYKMVARGSLIDMYAWNDVAQLEVAATLRLSGATATGTIWSPTGPSGPGIITLRGDGSRLWCTPYGNTPCGGSIELTPTACPAPTEEILGPSRWAVSEVVDARNNKASYAWTCEAKPNQECYPTSVSYNGTAIKFNRDIRPDPVSFVSGTQLGSSIKRIVSVDISTGGQRVRAYGLNYAVGGFRTVLEGISEYGHDATLNAAGVVTGGTRIGPTRFSYVKGWQLETSGGTNVASVYRPAATWAAGWCPAGSRTGAADINGDGRSDVWCNTNGTNKVAYSSWNDTSITGSLSPQTIKSGWCGNTGAIGTADFNGDGKADFFCADGGNISTLRSPDFVAGTRSGFCPGGVFGTADVTGDGMADIWCRQSSGNLVVAPSLGNSTTTGVAFGTAVTWAPSFCAPGDLVGTSDFNGDGRADFLCHGAGRIHVALSKGTTLGTRNIWASDYCMSNQPALQNVLGFGDFNGDGKSDVYCVSAANSEVRIGFSNGGTAFVGADNVSTTCSAHSPVGVGDFDGDGTDDLWCTHTNTKRSVKFAGRSSYYPAGVSIELDSAGWCAASSKLATTDFTGDGRADFFCAEAGNTNVVVIGNGNAGDLLSSIVELGASTTIDYRSSASWTNQNNPPVFQTVRRVEVTTPTTNGATDYSYSGGLYDRAERRFLGFLTSTVVHPANSGETARPSTVTSFRLDVGFPTVPSVVVQRDGSNRTMQSSSYNHTRYFGKIPYRSELTSQSNSPHSGATNCVAPDCRSTSVQFQYDVYGNAKTVFDYGETAVSGDERTTVVYFPYNTGKYIVGIPTETNVYKGLSSSGTKLQQSLHFYDNATTVTAPIAVGNLTKTMRLVLPGNTYVQTLAKYDVYGNLTEKTDEVGAVTKHTYDTTYHVFQTSTVNALSQTATTSWDFRCGVPLSAKDANGQSDTFQYDALCRETKRSMPGGNFVITKYFGFDSGSPRIRTETPGPQGGANLFSEQTFDGAGRVWDRKSSGPSAGKEIYSLTFYQPRGGIRSDFVPGYVGEGLADVAYKYDALNRVTQKSPPNFGAVNSTYFGNRTVTTDASNHKRETMTDGRGRVIKRREWNGATAVDTLIAYDDNDNPTTVTDAMGNVTTTVFDSLGRKTKIVDPDTGVTTYVYDAAGRIRSSTDSRGVTTTYTYDALSRLRSKGVSGGGVAAVTYTLEYDTAVSGSYNIGRLVKETFPPGSRSFTYDAVGRVTKETYVIGGVSYVFSHGYDSAGRLLYTTYPNGSTKGTAASPIRYDGAGRLLSIPGVLNNVQYDAAGNPTSITFANGAVTTKRYFGSMWLRDITTVSKGVTLQSLAYCRQENGQKQCVTSPHAEEGWNYDYDSLDRLKAATSHSNALLNKTFGYDLIGNISVVFGYGPANDREGRRYVYPAAKAPRPHAVSAIYSYDIAGNQSAPSPFAYDAVGNTLSGYGRTYTWDGFGNMASVNGRGRSLQFSYDSRGRRLRTIDNGATILSLGADYEVRGGLGAVTYFLGGTPVAEKRGTSLRFLHTTDQGSVNVVTDTAGAMTKRVVHGPYGEIVKSTSADFVSLDYTGEKRDSTELMYLNARYYDPAIGKFLSADSVVPELSSTGLNRFAYAGNDPINNTDRNGNSWLSDFGGGLWSSFTHGLNSFGQFAFGSFGGSGFGAAGMGGFSGFNPSCFNCMGQFGSAATQLNFGGAIADGFKLAGWSGGSGGPLSFGSAAMQVLPTTLQTVGEVGFGMFGGGILTAMMGQVRGLSLATNILSHSSSGIASSGFKTAIEPIEKRILARDQYFTRPLQISDFGKLSKIEDLEGTFSVRGRVATVTVDWMSGGGWNQFSSMNALKSLSAQHGADTLLFRGHVVNFELRQALEMRYGQPFPSSRFSDAMDTWTLHIKSPPPP